MKSEKNNLDQSSLLIYVIAIIILIITIAPFLWMALSSIKPESEILQFPPKWLPSRIDVSHYRELFEKVNFLQNFWNSFIVAISISFITILINSMAGFVFAKYRFKGRERLFTLMVATMMIPGQVTMIPSFMLLKWLGLLNSYLGLIIPGSASIFAIFLMRQFMMSIPDSLLEAARIDGCSEWRIFWQIMLPLCMPAIATLTIFTFMNSWNDFFGALIIMLEESKYTLPVALANLNGQHGTEWGILMAGSLVTIAPVLFVFLLMQRHYIRGIAMTGQKS
ncbi:MAG: sugar ABC transporter permease [Candidatus Hydrogenedentes bacterium CG07_land_8_20_14_0_80_42_17]|nr:MAG: sugar ABC transporter permease [Candidatus Hydrogenedentes bacterium CG1_02_42_14]PIU47743.1 MAG: sugar ABC transporter permease [Candidatus Hydrogenedentes bacterium CG07_land_8_20_14_0_80_42_17]